MFAAAPVSQGLFGHTHYQGLVRLVALVQLGIAWANLLLAVMKGFRDAVSNALSLIIGSVMGVLAWYLCFKLGGYRGRIAGAGIGARVGGDPGVGDAHTARCGSAGFFKPQWDKALAGQLSKFTLMALITSFTMPLAYVMMRNQLAAHYSWDEVGIWQGVSSISDAYLQFITASFTVYLLPTLSRPATKQAISREIVKSLRFVLPAVAAVSLTVWLLRDVAIWLLFSDKFTAMRDLFATATDWRRIESGCLRFWLSGGRQSVVTFLYSGGNQSVHPADAVFPRVNSRAWRRWRGAGLYGHICYLFRPLLRRVFDLA